MGWWVSAAQTQGEDVDRAAAPGGEFCSSTIPFPPTQDAIRITPGTAREGRIVLPCPPLYSQTDRGGRSSRLVG